MNGELTCGSKTEYRDRNRQLCLNTQSFSGRIEYPHGAYYIHRNNEVLRDLVSIQYQEFLSWLSTAKTIPQTASPARRFLSMYENLAEGGAQEILCLHRTSKGSGAYQAALAAADMLREKLPRLRIEVVDTLNVALCQGWMAIEAARAALAGASMETILEETRRMISQARIIQTADTLRYLYMGGRIGKAAHLAGSMLNLKPLISMQDGEIVALGVTRGLNKAYEKMVALIQAALRPDQKIKIAYLHAGAAEQIQLLKSKVENRLDCVESFTAELCPALMVHTGPGTTGLCYFPVNQ